MNMREFNVFIPMVDFFLCLMMAVFVLFASSLAEVNPPQPKKANKESTIGTEGIFAIILEWPPDSNDDIDLYVMNPDHEVAYFNNRNIGLMHYELDDRGSMLDSARSASGKTITVHRNEERVIIRGIIPGEYCVNVHVFQKFDGGKDIPVKVTVYRLKGSDVPVVEREVVLTSEEQEHTMFRMTLDEGENVSDINDLQRPIVGRPEPDR